MLRTKVKATAITSLTDARYFAAREVEWLGFDLSAGSDHYLPPAQVLAIREWVDGVKIVGEFALEPPSQIRAAAAELRLDAVQLSMVSPESTLRDLHGEMPLIREIVPDYYQHDDDLRELFTAGEAAPDYWLLNLEKNGFTWSDLKAGAPFTLAAVHDLCAQYAVLLALNFSPGDVEDILNMLPVQGLQLRGGAEERTGVKSFDELDAILDLLDRRQI